MISCNITTQVEWNVEASWLQWQLNENLPAMLRTGCFERYQLFRLMNLDEEEGPTYTIQLYAPTMDDYLEYSKNWANLFREKTIQKWGASCVSFHSSMELLH